MAPLAQALTDLVLQLRREGAGTYAGGIGLDDAEHETRRRRAKASASRGRAGDGVGGSDKRLGSVVDIESHAFRAYDQAAHALPPPFFQRQLSTWTHHV